MSTISKLPICSNTIGDIIPLTNAPFKLSVNSELPIFSNSIGKIIPIYQNHLQENEFNTSNNLFLMENKSRWTEKEIRILCEFVEDRLPDSSSLSNLAKNIYEADFSHQLCGRTAPSICDKIRKLGHSFDSSCHFNDEIFNLLQTTDLTLIFTYNVYKTKDWTPQDVKTLFNLVDLNISKVNSLYDLIYRIIAAAKLVMPPF
ncbi:MAG: hypothetical protein JHC93_06115, partial [Parachlamydiales bacterium]|nr:hypothetical protein [Parachlamydiales bacterium]